MWRVKDKDEHVHRMMRDVSRSAVNPSTLDVAVSLLQSQADMVVK